MSKAIWSSVFEKLEHGSIAVRWWDGQEITYGAAPAPITIIFHSEPSALKLLEDPIMTVGEAYMDGVIDFEGDWNALMILMRANFRREAKPGHLLRRGLSRAAQKLAGQKDNIKAHYDLGNDFFARWLDETLSYSCAYFINEGDDLKTAQTQKVDLILRKLRLEPGQRLLDIGCGWGFLLERAVRNYGVRAVGLTLSEEQYHEARRRFEEGGLAGSAEVRLLNYQELDPAIEKPFDRIVSVGMFEHVGRANFGGYFEKCSELLKPGGLAVLHTLTSLIESETNSWISKYIFPGGYIPSFREVAALLPDYDFHLTHAESLRRHYVRTLEIWLANFLRPDVYEWVLAHFDRRFARMWELYLRTAAASLNVGALDIHQIAFTKGVDNFLPMTLNDIYCAKDEQKV